MSYEEFLKEKGNYTNYYMELKGDVTNQVYKLNATTWETAKEEAWEQLNPGDSIAECTQDAIEPMHEDQFGNKNYGIIMEKCVQYVTLKCGKWIDLGKREIWLDDIYYYEPEIGEETEEDEYEYLGADGKPYDFDIIRREIEKQKKEEEEEEE